MCIFFRMQSAQEGPNSLGAHTLTHQLEAQARVNKPTAVHVAGGGTPTLSVQTHDTATAAVAPMGNVASLPLPWVGEATSPPVAARQPLHGWPDGVGPSSRLPAALSPWRLPGPVVLSAPPI
jgi:hypothetical protein